MGRTRNGKENEDIEHQHAYIWLTFDIKKYKKVVTGEKQGTPKLKDKIIHFAGGVLTLSNWFPNKLHDTLHFPYGNLFQKIIESIQRAPLLAFYCLHHYASYNI